MPKLSAIAAAGAPPAVTDTAVFVTGGAVDNLVTVTQLGAALPIATSTTRGQVPASGGGTTNFLRADLTFAAPPTTAPGNPSLGVQFNNAGAFAAMSGTSWDDTNRSLTMTGATVTVSHPVFDMTQTWNAGGVAFTGLRLNVTNTASAAASKLIDLQVGTATAFSITPVDASFGCIMDFQGVSGAPGVGTIRLTGTRLDIIPSGGTRLISLASGWIAATNTSAIGWSSGSDAAVGPDTGFTRVTSKVIACGDGGANTNAWIQTAGDLRLGSDVGFTTNTILATIMTANVQAGRTYCFDVYLSITGSAGGVQAAISGTATTTDVRYDGYVIDNAAGGTKGAAQAAALGTAVANPATITGPASAAIRGTVTVNAAGTLTVQAAQASSSGTTTTIKRGSWAFFRDTP